MQPAGPQDLRIVPEDWLAELDLRKYFGNDNPLEVDVGCGKGNFVLQRALANPDSNFLGIDRMLRRVRKVCNKAWRMELDNIRLLRMDASYAVSHMLPPDSVAVYYVFFPDPWPKKRHHENRFFDPLFLSAVKRTLRSGGLINVATDHRPFFEEIEALLEAEQSFVRAETFVPQDHERTEFERYYLTHKQIGRCSFHLI